MREIYIKNINAKIYIDKLDNTIDSKIRVYDSNKNYLDYYEDISFDNEKEYEKELAKLENAKTIQDLLSYFSLYENRDYELVKDYEMGDCVNIVGKYYILLF